MLEKIVINNLINLRKECGLTQEEAGDILGLSRPTYNGLETGKRPPTTDDLEKLAKAYRIPVTRFFEAPRDDRKFEQMYFQVLKHFPEGVPKTKLAKLLYLIDFSNFYDNLESMSGMQYIRRQYGPVAENFFEMTDNFYDEGKIDIKPMEYTLLIKPLVKSPEDDLLSSKDKERIDKICELWKDRRTAEIVQYTHEQNPWRSCVDGEKIPYELIVQEDPDHVYEPA